MPYVLAPPWARWALYVLRATMYTALLASGVGAWLLTPTTVSDRLPEWIADAWGGLAIVGALGALYGSLTRRYRWEVSALPFLIAATLVYAATIWNIVGDAPTRLAQAAAVTGLVLALTIRYVDLLLVAARMRRAHDRATG